MPADRQFGDETESTALSLPEELTRQFYEWERRGRGWQLWDVPVELEPPFRPCYYRLPSPETNADAGRRQTWLSRLVKLFVSDGNRGREENDGEDDASLLLEPEPELDLHDEPIAEFEVLPPPDTAIDKTAAERLILNLSYCGAPIAYEVVGTSDGIRAQYACRESDSDQVQQQLQAHVPDAMVGRRGQALKDQWRSRNASVVVDFGLSQEFIRPLRTSRNFAPDPLIGVVASLSQLRQSEVGVLQVLFQPTRAAWAQSVFHAVTDSEGGSFFVDAPEMVSLAREKISLPLYAVVVRVAARSASHARSMEIARGIGAALAQFALPGSNEFIPLTNEDYPDGLHESDLLFRQSRRSGMILNSDELVSIAHPPSESVRVPKLRQIGRASCRERV